MKEILDENFYDLIVNNAAISLEDNGTITNLNERYSMRHVEVQDFSMCDLGRYSYNSFPTLYTLSSRVSLGRSNILQVQSNTLLSLFGSGVIVGVIDTGIAYPHPAFRSNDNTSRILSIWDQTVQDGNPPEGFTFGSEYNQDMINLALESEDPLSIVPTTDLNGHGTAIASIIAGRPDASQSFSGVVPQSELVVVKLKEAKRNLKRIFCVPEDALCYQETDITLGIRYIFEFARNLGRPLVICLAIGSSMAGHEAVGAMNSYINYLCQLPRVNISIAVGNEGNARRHHFGEVTSSPFSQEFELRVSANDPSFAFEIWPDIQARLAVQISAPDGEPMQLVYPSFSACVEHHFILNPTTVWVNNMIIEEDTGTQLILVRFNNAEEGIWRVRVVNVDSNPFSYHCWLPSGNLISNETFFSQSTPDATITSPGNTEYAMTVGAYNQFDGSLLISSSRGYTRFNHVKPNIAAPGYELPCAVPNGGYLSLTGTGAAAAHVAGAIAMVFEWAAVRGNYPFITGNDINTLLMRGAARNPSFIYPNNMWGYGELDLYSLFELLTFV